VVIWLKLIDGKDTSLTTSGTGTLRSTVRTTSAGETVNVHSSAINASGGPYRLPLTVMVFLLIFTFG